MARMLILTLIMMMILHLSLTDQSLRCHHDYFNTFTCVWNISNLDLRPPITDDTNCTLHVYVTKTSTHHKSQRMTMKSSEVNILTASVEFKNKRGIIIPVAKISQKVMCENHKNPVAQTKQQEAKMSVKLFPPVELKVDGFNVSWSRGTPLKSTLKSHVFELQFRSDEQSWTDVETTRVTELRVELEKDLLVLDQRYVLRVRAKLHDQSTAVWSDWSTEYKWTSKVGRPRPPPVLVPGDAQELNWSSLVIWITVTGIVLALILILSLLFKYNTSKWQQKMRSSYIPDPSKYFTDLNSHHTGNFKSWLGSAFALDHFIAVHSELVSPVEVVKLQVAHDSRLVDRHGDAARDGWENTSKTSNFSNSTYFLSQSSKGPMDALEPCSAHCSYGPAGGIGGPGEVLQNSARGAEESDEASELENSLKRLEQLRQDTQSPDSGFAAGADDSMEETELPSPPPLLNLPAPHPDKHLLLSWEQTPLVPANIRLIPHIDLDLKLLSSCGMIEPSSGDYMPVANVQN